MDGAADHELSDEIEVAQARLEGLLEDRRDQYDIEFENLSNVEILTLATTFHNGAELFAAQGGTDQARVIHGFDKQLREQAEPLFEELADIHEPVMQQAMQNEAESTKSSSLLQRVLPSKTSPFTIDPPNPMLDRAWRLGLVLILVQAVAAIWHVGSFLLDQIGFGSNLLDSGLAALGLAVFSVIALGCFAFATGIAYEKYRPSSPN